MHSNEDKLLDRLSVDIIFSKIPSQDRELLSLHFAVSRPESYKGSWPPTISNIQQHISSKYGLSQISRRTVYNRINRALDRARALVIVGSTKGAVA